MSARRNFNIPDDIYERVRKIAVAQGRTVTDVVNSLLGVFIRDNMESFEKRLEKLESEVEQIKDSLRK